MDHTAQLTRELEVAEGIFDAHLAKADRGSLIWWSLLAAHARNVLDHLMQKEAQNG